MSLQDTPFRLAMGQLVGQVKNQSTGYVITWQCGDK